jgi:hypothetical protein
VQVVLELVLPYVVVIVFAGTGFFFGSGWIKGRIDQFISWLGRKLAKKDASERQISAVEASVAAALALVAVPVGLEAIFEFVKLHWELAGLGPPSSDSTSKDRLFWDRVRLFAIFALGGLMLLFAGVVAAKRAVQDVLALIPEVFDDPKMANWANVTHLVIGIVPDGALSENMAALLAKLEEGHARSRPLLEFLTAPTTVPKSCRRWDPGSAEDPAKRRTAALEDAEHVIEAAQGLAAGGQYVSWVQPLKIIVEALKSPLLAGTLHVVLLPLRDEAKEHEDKDRLRTFHAFISAVLGPLMNQRALEKLQSVTSADFVGAQGPLWLFSGQSEQVSATDYNASLKAFRLLFDGERALDHSRTVLDVTAGARGFGLAAAFLSARHPTLRIGYVLPVATEDGHHVQLYNLGPR